MMRTEPLRLAAAACAVAYLGAFLLLPCVAIAIVGIGMNGAQSFQISAWAVLPVLAAVVMGACCLVAPKIPAAIVSVICAFMPMITSAILRGEVVNVGGSLLSSVLGISIPNLFSSTVENYALTMGIGAIVCLVLGCVAAVLCFVEGNSIQSKPRDHGYSVTNDDNEW